MTLRPAFLTSDNLTMSVVHLKTLSSLPHANATLMINKSCLFSIHNNRQTGELWISSSLLLGLVGPNIVEINVNRLMTLDTMNNTIYNYITIKYNL